MKTEITYIYGLTDGDKVRYIGKSDNPRKRLLEHIKESEPKNKTHKHKWINKMVKNNSEIGVKILEVVPSNELKTKEIFWIEILFLSKCIS